jgi:hypothetical protein
MFSLSFESPDEEATAIKNYQINKNAVIKHNARADLGYASYHVKMNKYSHISKDQFQAAKTGYQPPLTYKRVRMLYYINNY